MALEKEAEMSALNSGLFLVSAVASGSGLNGLSQETFKLRTSKKTKKRVKRADPNYTPISARRKEELMQSILHDDWHE
jgi:hypothetical protein